jgi:ribosomal-protein-alanine N-acetyltransferase
MLSAVLELDNLCFGGLWTLEGYQRELDSPNSVLLGLFLEDSGQGDKGTRGQGDKEKINENSPPLLVSPSPPHLLSMGCFWEIVDEAHITLLAVDPRYQRQGLGQAMLFALIAEAVDRGLERATLEVRDSNQSALSLYQKFGFKIAGRRRRYYKDTNEDALILWRSDLQHPESQTTLAKWYQSVSDRSKAFGWDFQLPQTFSTTSKDYLLKQQQSKGEMGIGNFQSQKE